MGKYCIDCKAYNSAYCTVRRKDIGPLNKPCGKFDPIEENANLLTPDVDKSTSDVDKSTENVMAKEETMVCKVCGQEKPLSEFGVAPRNPEIHFTTCKSCQAKKAAEAKKRHDEEKAQERAAVPSVPPVETKPEEQVNHPKHYQLPNGAEALDICRYMSFNLGNAIKYIVRAGKKDPSKMVEDLEKARFYIDDEIKRLIGE